MATNLALQLQVIEPDTDLNSIMIGNSNYNDDVWDLRPFITAKSTKESHKYINLVIRLERSTLAVSLRIPAAECVAAAREGIFTL